MKARARLALVPLLAILFAASVASAQDYGQPPPPAYGQTYEQAPAARPFSQEELEQMLAPIALYPDSLLSQILMASTYPLEVVEAARWSRANPGLQGDQAVAAAAQFDWDPSVKSLTAFPQILLVMDQRLEWMQRLGDAFLAQQAQMMDTVQYLRRKAYDAGNLRTNEEIQVEPVAQAIDINFANPEVVYVPYYDPTVVYGPWWWPSYPPVYWAPWPGYALSYQPGLYWGPAIGVSFGFFFGAVNWHSHRVDVIHNDYYDRRFARHRFEGRGREAITPWRHEPEHRRNVPYRSPEVRQHFGPENRPAETRERYRGYQAPRSSTGATMNRQIPHRETEPPRALQPAQRAVPNRNAPAQLAPRPATRPQYEHRPGASEAVPRGEQARESSPRGRAQEYIAPRRAPATRAPASTPAARPPAPAARPPAPAVRPPAAAVRPPAPAVRPPAPAVRPPAPAARPPAIAPAARPPTIAPAPRTAAPNPPERPAERRREER
jgi:Protein of unknown function (DUF3300)